MVEAFPREVWPETANVPVAVTLAAVRFPVKRPLPATSNLLDGEEVPMPTLPFERIDKTLVAALLKNSAILPAPLCKTFRKVEALEVEF